MIISDIKTVTGSLALPVVDNAIYYSDILDSKYSRSTLYLEFFSDAELSTPVSPTWGSIRTWGTPTGNLWIVPGDYGLMLANDFTYPDALYDPPVFNGFLHKVKIKFEGITGAAYCKAFLVQEI